MEYVFLLIFTACVAAGVVSAVVKTWAFHKRIYSLEDRMGVLEGVQTREVKIRAAQSRTPKSQSDEALLHSLQANPAPGRKLNWWEKQIKAG